jgi:hypothetical protein
MDEDTWVMIEWNCEVRSGRRLRGRSETIFMLVHTLNYIIREDKRKRSMELVFR